MTLKIISSKSNQIQNVIWASRNLNFEHKNFELWLYYHFQLHSKLRLNFTFHRIYSFQATLRVMDSTRSNTSFSYTRHFSTFCLYLEFQKIYLQIIPWVKTTHGHSISFGHFTLKGRYVSK